MAFISTFITDRTQTDVVLLNEKGTLNYLGMQRVEDSLKLITDYLWRDYSYFTWTRANIPKQSDYQKIKDAIDYIHGLIVSITGSDMLTVPSLPINTYQKWNELETFLKYTYENIYATMQKNIYAGEFYAGEIL